MRWVRRSLGVNRLYIKPTDIADCVDQSMHAIEPLGVRTVQRITSSGASRYTLATDVYNIEHITVVDKGAHLTWDRALWDHDATTGYLHFSQAPESGLEIHVAYLSLADWSSLSWTPSSTIHNDYKSYSYMSGGQAITRVAQKLTVTGGPITYYGLRWNYGYQMASENPATFTFQLTRDSGGSPSDNALWQYYEAAFPSAPEDRDHMFVRPITLVPGDYWIRCDVDSTSRSWVKIVFSQDTTGTGSAETQEYNTASNWSTVSYDLPVQMCSESCEVDMDPEFFRHYSLSLVYQILSGRPDGVGRKAAPLARFHHDVAWQRLQNQYRLRDLTRFIERDSQ